MANHPSAEKRQRQNEKRRIRNAARRAQIRTAEKKLDLAIENKNKTEVETTLKKFISEIMTAKSKGILHGKTVTRKVARKSKQAWLTIKSKKK